ncbi:hypothetical protein FQR65_LT11885 [Abscondita terminalis]|nr:hypothetical protein FQR65_LT11885 [Abscondita terminalis]
MTWCVVHFTAEQTVEVVPKSWTIESQECFWPNGYNRKKIIDAVKSKESPSCSWSIFSIKILGTYGKNVYYHGVLLYLIIFVEDLLVAQIKCNRAKDRDDLSSSADELAALGKGLRVRKSRIHPDFDCSDEEIEYPSMPTIPKPRNEVCHKGQIPENPRLQEVNSPEDQYLSEQANQLSVQTDKGFNREFQEIHSVMGNVTSALTQLTTENGEFQRQVMRQLHIINARIKELMENQELLMKSDRNNETPALYELSEQLQEVMNMFPIQNLHDLNKMEDILKNPQQMNLIAKELSRLGGGTVKEITKRIMFSILNNKTAQFYSWEGQKGKQKFKDLQLGKLIIKAVRFNEKTKEASEADIIKPLREWLVRAKFRQVQTNSQPDDA